MLRSIRDILTCSRCGSQQERPYELTHSTFAQCPFVCENCRCKSCSIVLNIECECGQRHAEPSFEDPRICTECLIIQKRVANLDPELLQLRNDIASEQEPVYGVRLAVPVALMKDQIDALPVENI